MLYDVECEEPDGDALEKNSLESLLLPLNHPC
jgi:hypothetical protein